MITELDEERLKIAAIALCELRGVDPRAMRRFPDPDGHAVVRRRPAWVSASEEIKAQLLINRAIEVGSNS